MTGKLLFIITIYTAIAMADASRLKKLQKREKAAYAAMLLLSLYLSLNYLLDLTMPFLGEVAYALFSGPTKHIVDFLKVTS